MTLCLIHIKKRINKKKSKTQINVKIGGGYEEMVIIVETDTTNRLQTMDEAVSVFHWKRYESNDSSFSYGQIVGKTGLFNDGMTILQKEQKRRIPTCLDPFKN